MTDKIVFTGGGTSGHVTPNIALIKELENYQIFYIGSQNGIEAQLITSEKIRYYSIRTGKLRRYFSWQNLFDIINVIIGTFQAFNKLWHIKPKLIFSKGGFVSCPVIWAARFLSIPIIIHESDYSPGLANRLAIPFAKKICYSFPETKRYLPHAKSILTGIPIRKSLFRGNSQQGNVICNFKNVRPTIMIMGGSLGSVIINKVMRESLENLGNKYNICHICGKGNLDPKLNNLTYYQQFEYVNKDLPHLFAIAEIVISRAGATSIFELLSLQKPHILIPLSLKASRGDQLMNADSFEKSGYSMVIKEENLTKETLCQTIEECYQKRHDFKSNMQQSNMQNGINKVIDTMKKFL